METAVSTSSTQATTWNPQQHRAERLKSASVQRLMYKPVVYGVLLPMIKLYRAIGKEQDYYRNFVAGPTSNINKQMATAFEGYTPTEHDVFVCSYFKSGTNWTMQMAHQVANLGAGEFEHIHDVVAWPDAPDPKFSVSIHDPMPQVQAPTGLRAIKTHSMAENVPYSEKAKYICVVRDPKDVFVSSYFFFRSVLFGKLMPSVETWLDIFLSEQAFHGEWADFTQSYWPWRERENVLFLTFGEMKADLEGTVRRIAELMNVELTSEQLAETVQRSSFSYMKKIDHKFYTGSLSPFGLKEGSMMRKGKKGGSDELLNAEQQARIDAYMKAALAKAGSDFPYDEYFG